MSGQPLPAKPAQARDESVSTGRRRLLKGAGAVTPGVITFVSGPVVAGVCAPPSTHASLNASRPRTTTYTCSGNIPAYWVQDVVWPTWPAPYVASGTGATLFDTIFGATGGYAGKTLLQVLTMPEGSGKDGMAPYIAASVLNAAAGLTPGVMDLTLLKRIWADVVRRNFYTPSAGIKWYCDYSQPPGSGGIKAWLKSTMGSIA
jgi:hypothetical protein